MSNQAQSPDERFDVVDANDCVIGQATRKEVHAKKLFHRAVHILVFRSDGRVLLQQRSLLKDTSPGKWTTSCSGHVDSGETYEQAALRELREEIAIEVSGIEALTEVGYHSPCAENGWEFIRIYRTQSDQAPKGHPHEVAALAWKTPAEVAVMLREEAETFSPAFALVWSLVS